MIPRATPEPKSLKQQQQQHQYLFSLPSYLGTPSPHPSPFNYKYLHKHHLSPTITATTFFPPPSEPQHTSEETKNKKNRQYQYNKAYIKKLKQDGKFEQHKERVRMYNAKRRQTLNILAKTYGLSIRKMEQRLKETKKTTGVDLLSIAIKGDQQQKVEHGSKRMKIAEDAVLNNDMPSARTPLQQQQVDVSINAGTTASKDIPAAQTYLAQRCAQTPQLTQASLEKKESKKLPAKNKVITPSTTPRPVVNTTDNYNSEKQKKNKHNQHNRAYRDKLKQDKRRYEEHKEKARQYNEKRRKKLRAMAKETGLTMKEMEKTIREAKIVSALTVTASKEAEELTPPPPVPTRHLVPVVVPPVPRPPLQAAAATTNCLDILSDAASIVLSQSHHFHQTPMSPRRQHRTVSEDNGDTSMEGVRSNW